MLGEGSKTVKAWEPTNARGIYRHQQGDYTPASTPRGGKKWESSGQNGIEKGRELLGPTYSKKAAPGTIRGDFGVDVMVNVVHASDSAEAAKAELARFFLPGELFDYALAG